MSSAMVNASSTGDQSAIAGTSTSAQLDLADYWNDDFAPLDAAGKAVLKVLREDETSPHGDLYRRILSSTAAAAATATSASTSSDAPPNHHYFNQEGTWAHARSVPLPTYLQDKVAKAKVATLMGLFPEAQMAWMTVDDTIYLWSYHVANPSSNLAENDFLYFQVPTKQPIVSVGLAPPKKGVFDQVVEWCLVVTTKEEAMICALARKNDRLTAVPTRFVIPSDWISFLSVTSTKDGRIFLGGQDGNLYELDYDLLAQSHSASTTTNAAKAGDSGQPLIDVATQLENFYDGDTGICPAQLSETVDDSASLLISGKRLLTRVLQSQSHTQGPARKCRKLNHSKSVVSSFVPGIVNQLTSAIFGDSTTTGAGPIIQMTVDEERQVLYTLSTRGWICALDIAESPKITLAAVLNTASTARLYLEAVSRGRMYAPSTSNTKDGHLAFPGGGEAAQAGVGGMEGARRILKIAESRNSNNGRRSTSLSSLLTPVAIQVIPASESTRITLVAITDGGMRYYLSSLNPKTLGTGPAMQPFGTPRQRQSIKPYNRMTLCHIRAPPSLVEADALRKSQLPQQPADYRIDASCYRNGIFFAAFAKKVGGNAAGSTTTASSMGNVLVVANAVSKARPLSENKNENNETRMTFLTPGGICEAVSFPLALHGASSNSASVLPGGRIWDICTATFGENKILPLLQRSRTPTDSELGFGIAPAYVSPLSKSGKKKNDTSSKKDLATEMPVSKYALKVVANLLLSRPANYGFTNQRTITGAKNTSKMYRISRHSVVGGFSLSATDSKLTAGVGSNRSARLSPWLLRPEVVPLNPMAVQYLDPPSSSFVALNAGGLHEVKSPSVLQQLASSILAAGSNARTDQNVTKFFESYGYGEGCAMCLFLAMRPSSSNDLKEFAMRAALARAYRPSMSFTSANEQRLKEDPWVPNGYVFSASALYEGLTMAVARVLRPFWYKPAVVITEGRLLNRGSATISTEAKVELLFNDEIMDDIRVPVDALRNVITRVFSKAIQNVPLTKNTADTTNMDVDDEQHFLTRTLEYQRKSQNNVNAAVMRASEADELAQHIEERNIHSLYRLISRTSQFLSLMTLLKRAHFMSDLPEVEWGQLHGISVAQLIQAREGQDRLEALLNNLVTSLSTNTAAVGASADAKNLAQLLSEQCYHFFSPGSRYTYFGFQAAQEALALGLDQQSRRLALIHDAVTSLKQATNYWCSPSLISGRTLQTSDVESYDKIADRAYQYDSPLAKACALLIELEDVASLVHICLDTASNFSQSAVQQSGMASWRNLSGELHWERGLYHRRQIMQPLRASTAVTGTTVTGEDAVKTCHALILHHVSRLLNCPVATAKYNLGEKMISVCSSSSDVIFLNRLFSHLVEKNQVDVLLRIDSLALEKWLMDPKSGNLELLFKYYHIQENFIEAGNVAWNHATESNVDRDLNERIEYLIEAVDSFSTAKERGHGDQNVVTTRLNASKDRLRIAQLQSRIAHAIRSTKYEVSSEAIGPLNLQLMEANELMNKYAIPYDMFDCCLLLIHACKYNDEAAVEQFWKSLLCEEIFPCYTRDERTYRSLRGFIEGSMVDNPTIQLLGSNEVAPGALFEEGNWMNTLKITVVRLGEDLCSAQGGFAFPVDFVATCLEELRHAYVVAVGEVEGTRTEGWTCSVLTAAGVSYFHAIRGYENFVEKKNRSTMGLEPRKRLQQIQTIISMLEDFDEATRSSDRLTSDAATEEIIDVYSSGALRSLFDDYLSKLQSLMVDTSFEERRIDNLAATLRNRYG